MKKEKILYNYELTKLGNTVFIKNNHLVFSYTPYNDIAKEEYKDKYRYIGGLQCNYEENTEEYKQLEQWLCEIAEKILCINNY